jgi:ferredoxin
MDELRKRAKELLESGAARLVIGYEQGTGNKIRPSFQDSPEKASRLIFDSRCVPNLAVYLTKSEVKKTPLTAGKGGKLAIVASVPVMRSIIQLASENQITEDDLIVLGVTPDLNLIEFSNLKEIEIYLAQHKIELTARDEEILKKLDHLSAAERWKFWIEALEPCFKCYACRAACPLCYCTRCTVDNNRPQWVPVASHRLGNLEWHLMRAMHMAGRCTDCEACANACPVGIPLNLLTKKIRQEMNVDFGESVPSLTGGNTMSTFKPGDKENFIN